MLYLPSFPSPKNARLHTKKQSIVGSKLDDATLEKLVSWKHEH
jgi:hypothetical protein